MTSRAAAEQQALDVSTYPVDFNSILMSARGQSTSLLQQAAYRPVQVWTLIYWSPEGTFKFTPVSMCVCASGFKKKKRPFICPDFLHEVGHP